ncbi:MAG: hypothetical protein LUC45_04400 [Paraprevotella sp.]|nr:hypothetical protein [Paraprevotella sp.]
MGTTQERNNVDPGKIDVDIWNFIPKLRKSFRFILFFALGFAVFGGIIAFGHPKTYRAELVLSPELGTTKESYLSSIADMGGLSFDFGSKSEAVNVMIYPNVVSSKSFLMGLTNIPVRTEESADTVSLQSFYKHRDTGWLDGVRKGIESVFVSFKGEKDLKVGGGVADDGSLIQISEKEDAFISMLKTSITVDVDDKTGLIIVASTTPDPYVSAILTDTVGKRLQSYITRYRTTKAKLDYDYFDKMSDEAEAKYKSALATYAHNVDSNMQPVLQRVKGTQEKLEADVSLASQVYTQLKQKKELAKAKIQEVKPAFVVIDPVSVPLKATGIGRLFTILLSFIMGSILASIWVLVGRQIWDRLRKGDE